MTVFNTELSPHQLLHESFQHLHPCTFYLFASYLYPCFPFDALIFTEFFFCPILLSSKQMYRDYYIYGKMHGVEGATILAILLENGWQQETMQCRNWECSISHYTVPVWCKTSAKESWSSFLLFWMDNQSVECKFPMTIALLVWK